MRILHITERFGTAVVGGAQQSVALLAHSQSMAGHDVGVICVADTTRFGAVDRASTEQKLRLWQLPLSRTSALLRRPTLSKGLSLACYVYDGLLQRCDPSVTAVVRDFKPQIINTHILTGVSDSIWSVADSLGIPVVHTLRDFYLLCARSSMFKTKTMTRCARRCSECRVITLRRRRLSGTVSGYVGISNRIVEIHRIEGVLEGARPTVVIPNAVTLPKDPTSSRTGNHVDRDFVIGYMGRIVPAKGVEQLIKAFARARMPRATLRIAGEGDQAYIALLRDVAKRHRIEFAGKTTPQAFLSGCNALAVPSLWEEPFGRVVAEALLMQVPLICSNRGSFPELLGRFPGGMLTDPEDEDRFASDLHQLRADATRLTSWLAGHHASLIEYFSSDSVARQYGRFYQEVLNGRECH